MQVEDVVQWSLGPLLADRAKQSLELLVPMADVALVEYRVLPLGFLVELWLK